MPFPTEKPSEDPCKQRAFARTEPSPTGIAIADDILYVATYGKIPTPPPAIHMFRISDNLAHVGDLAVGDVLALCFPEALAVHGTSLFVACGANGRILVYDTTSRTLVNSLAGSLGLPAIWGVAVHDGDLYFSSHCTWEQINGQNYCKPEEHDAIFRISLEKALSMGEKADAEIQLFARGPQPNEEGHAEGERHHVRLPCSLPL